MLRKPGMAFVALCITAAFGVAGCSDDDSGSECGDGIIEGSEVCDGSQLGGATCVDEGFTGGVLSCTDTCDGFDVSLCTNDMCGDGEVTGMEDCDGANLNMTSCEDLNFDGGTLACNQCAFDDSGCYNNCGDGTIQAGDEVCDGTDLGGDDCTDHNFDGGQLACAADCTAYDTGGCCSNNCTTAGDTQCTGDTLGTCTLGSNGCLDWVNTDCTATNETCGGTPADCVPACTDDCVNAGDTLCLGNVLQTCTVGSDSCLDWVGTDCGTDWCFGSPAACNMDAPTGESCADATAILTFPAQFTGSDFTVDFPMDDHDFDGATNCHATSSATNVDAVFRVDMNPNDTLVVTEHGSMDAVIHIVAADVTTCLDASACLDSIDSYESTIGATHVAAAAESVYVVVEPWSGSPTSVGYDIRINLTPQVCGDSIVGPTEVCDDGNTTAADGCAADCSAVDAGYTCIPGICYTTGTGDVCATPIPLTAGTYAFDTTGFTNDYDDYNGACGTNMTGAGPDAVFEIDVPDGQLLEIVNTDSVDFDAVVVLADDCSDIVGSCLSHSDPEVGAYYNDTGAAKTIYFIIDGWYSYSEGVFEFTVNLGTPVTTCGDGIVELGEACDDGNTTANDGCAADCSAVDAGYTCTPGLCYTTGSGDDCTNPIPLTAGTYAFDTTGFTDDYDDYNGACGTNMTGAGPDAVFEIDVPDGQLLEIVNTDSIGFDAVVVLADNCSDVVGSCLTYSDPEVGTYYNDTGAAQTIYFILDGYYSYSEGVFEFTVNLGTPVTTCGDGVVELGEACDDGNTTPSDGCAADCSAVDSGYTCSGEPSFCYTTGTGDVCATPIPLTAGSYSFDTSGFTNDYDDYNGACGTNMTGAGADAIFAVDVPDGATVEILNSDSVDFDAVVVFADNCTDIMGSCLDWNDTPEEVSYINSTGAAQTVYFIIDGYYSYSEGTFDFTLNIDEAICGDGDMDAGEECDDGDTTPGDGCDASCMLEPTPIAASGSSIVFNGSIDNTDPQYARPLADCSSSSGADHYYDVYAIENTTGSSQTITVTAAWSGDGYVHLWDRPLDLTAQANCLIGDDDYASNGSQIVSYTIPAGEVFIIVASTFSGNTATGSYTITVDTD